MANKWAAKERGVWKIEEEGMPRDKDYKDTMFIGESRIKKKMLLLQSMLLRNNTITECFLTCKVEVKVAQLCPLFATPLGILQAGMLEWVAVPFSRGSSQSGDWT